MKRCDEACGIEWDWLSADGCMTKTPLALQSIGNNHANRGKKEASAFSGLPASSRAVVQ